MASIKLLLKESVKHVGKVGDVVEVSPGYARNFLIPRDLAVEPTANNVKKIEARRKEIERLEEEKKGIQDDIKDVYTEAKGTGFDPGIIRQVVRLRKKAKEERQEEEELLELYKAALGME